MAVVLNASGEYLSYSGTQLDARNDYTWMTWVRTTNAGIWQGVLSFSAGEGSNQYETIEITDSDQFGLFSMDSQAGYTGTSISLNTWYHVAMVKSGTTLYLYVGGSLSLTITNVADNDLTAGAMLWGHWSTGGDQLLGRLSYSRAWTTALNSTQIATERDSTTPVVTTGLWGDWPLQTNGNDTSGNGRNLTSNGSVSWDTSDEPISGGPTTITFTDSGSGVDSTSVDTGSPTISLIGSSTNQRTAGTSMVLNRPTGTLEGHLMVASLWHELANPTITPPSGWTLLFQTNVSTRTANLAAYYRVAGASEPSTYTWTVPTSSECVGAILTLENGGTPTAVSQGNNTSTTTVTAPTITVNNAGEWVLFIDGAMYGTTVTPPTNYTEVIDNRSGTASGNCHLGVSYRQYSSTGATGSITATLANADYNAGAQILIPISVPSTIITFSDTGSGADVNPSATVSLTSTDTGTGAESTPIGATTLSTDSGTSSTSISVGALIGLTDILTALSETVSKSVLATWVDALFGAEATSVIAQLGLTDALVASDTENIDVSLGIGDTGALEDVYGAIANVLTILESASASENTEVAAYSQYGDTGSGAEAASFNVTAYFSDTASALDLVTILTNIFKTVTDTVTGADLINQLTVYFPPISDTGLFYDTDQVLVNLSFTEAGLGTDSVVTITGTMIAFLENAYGLDAVALQASTSISESGSALDSLNLAVQFAITESGLGTEELLLAYYMAIIDSGVLDDTGLTITVFIPLSDLGAAVEVSQILSTLAISDSGSLVDFSTKFDSATKKLVAQISFSRKGTGLQLTGPGASISGSSLSAEIGFRTHTTVSTGSDSGDTDVSN